VQELQTYSKQVLNVSASFMAKKAIGRLVMVLLGLVAKKLAKSSAAKCATNSAKNEQKCQYVTYLLES
jgi:hypothetical protein